MTDVRKTGYNKGFTSCWVTSKLVDLCFVSSPVQSESFVLRNVPEHNAQAGNVM